MSSLSSTSSITSQPAILTWGKQLKSALKSRMTHIRTNVDDAIVAKFPGADKAKTAAAFIFDHPSFGNNLDLMLNKIIDKMNPEGQPQEVQDVLGKIDTDRKRYAHLATLNETLEKQLSAIIKKAMGKEDYPELENPDADMDLKALIQEQFNKAILEICENGQKEAEPLPTTIPDNNERTISLSNTSPEDRSGPVEDTRTGMGSIPLYSYPNSTANSNVNPSVYSSLTSNFSSLSLGSFVPFSSSSSSSSASPSKEALKSFYERKYNELENGALEDEEKKTAPVSVMLAKWRSNAEASYEKALELAAKPLSLKCQQDYPDLVPQMEAGYKLLLKHANVKKAIEVYLEDVKSEDDVTKAINGIIDFNNKLKGILIDSVLPSVLSNEDFTREVGSEAVMMLMTAELNNTAEILFNTLNTVNLPRLNTSIQNNNTINNPDPNDPNYRWIKGYGPRYGRNVERCEAAIAQLDTFVQSRSWLGQDQSNWNLNSQGIQLLKQYKSALDNNKADWQIEENLKASLSELSMNIMSSTSANLTENAEVMSFLMGALNEFHIDPFVKEFGNVLGEYIKNISTDCVKGVKVKNLDLALQVEEAFNLLISESRDLQKEYCEKVRILKGKKGIVSSELGDVERLKNQTLLYLLGKLWPSILSKMDINADTKKEINSYILDEVNSINSIMSANLD